MISNICSFIAQEWHSATHDAYFKLIISIVIICEVIRCVLVVFACVTTHLVQIIKDMREQMSETWSAWINWIRKLKKKKRNNQQKDITNEKGNCKEEKEETKKEDVMN